MWLAVIQLVEWAIREFYLQILKVANPQKEVLLRSYWYLKHVCVCMEEAIRANSQVWFANLEERNELHREYDELKGLVSSALTYQIKARKDLAEAQNRPFVYTRKEALEWLSYEDTEKRLRLMFVKSNLAAANEKCRHLETLNVSLVHHKNRCDAMVTDAMMAMHNLEVGAKLSKIPGTSILAMASEIGNVVYKTTADFNQNTNHFLAAEKLLKERLSMAESTRPGEVVSQDDAFLDELFMDIPIASSPTPVQPRPHTGGGGGGDSGNASLAHGPHAARIAAGPSPSPLPYPASALASTQAVTGRLAPSRLGGAQDPGRNNQLYARQAVGLTPYG